MKTFSHLKKHGKKRKLGKWQCCSQQKWCEKLGCNPDERVVMTYYVCDIILKGCTWTK